MSADINPEQWTRLPSTGERFLGMSRSTLYRFMKAGRIRYSTLAQPGCKTGLTFFSATDLIALIRDSMKGGSPDQPPKS